MISPCIEPVDTTEEATREDAIPRSRPAEPALPAGDAEQSPPYEPEKSSSDVVTSGQTHIPALPVLLDALGIAAGDLSNLRVEVSTSGLRLLISELVRAGRFDAEWYAGYYADLQAAYLAGQIASLYEHYVTRGYFEERLPYSRTIDPDWYWTFYRDVTPAYDRLDVAGICTHFFSKGWLEGRVGTPELAQDAERWIDAVRRLGSGPEDSKAIPVDERLQGHSEPAPGAASAKRTAEQVLLQGFESLGWNCEFGLVQKYYNVNHWSLLAFANMPLANLTEALGNGFDGFGSPENMFITLEDNKEYGIIDSKYGYRSHTWTHQGQFDPHELQRRECKRIQFLKERFIHHLRSGEKVFVYKKQPECPERAVYDLYCAIGKYGKNTLLWVDEGRHRAGEVKVLSEGFYKGYIDKFSPEQSAGSSISYRSWLQICDRLNQLRNDAATPILL